MKTSQLGQRIRQLRLERGLTQDQLAEDTFSKSYISAIELGKIKPSLTSLNIIANRLKVPVAELVSDLTGRPAVDGTLTLRRATLLARIDGQAQAALALLATVKTSNSTTTVQKLLAEGQILLQLGESENAARKLAAARKLLKETDSVNLAELALNILKRETGDTDAETLVTRAENLLTAHDLATRLEASKGEQ
jgi:transcriptional regulator with XRE-family HTH domain